MSTSTLPSSSLPIPIPNSTTTYIPFPKIGDINTFIHVYTQLLKTKQVSSGPITLLGTVKLHGTHADIIVPSSGNLYFQSRNRVITPEEDNHECAKTLTPLREEILELTRQFAGRFRELTGKEADREVPVIIAGEWVGPKVQPAVALSLLPRKYFVILGCKINNVWVPISSYHDLHLESHGIYNISRGGFHSLTISLSASPSIFKQKIAEITKIIEARCPFTYNVFSVTGIGEGIVWIPSSLPPSISSDPRYWFKSKGEIHRNSNTDALLLLKGGDKKKMRNQDAKTKARVFAEKAVSENRLVQGRDFLREMGFKREEEQEQFLGWLCRDVLEEEKLGVKALGIDVNMLRNAVREIGLGWYKRNVGRGDD